MAASCPKCGAAVVSGMQTCQFCGTSVQGAGPGPATSERVESPAEKVAPEPLGAALPAPAPAPAPAATATAAMPPAQASGSSTVPPKTRMLLYAATAAATLIGLVLVVSIARANFAFSFFGDSNHSPTVDTPHPMDATPPASAASATDLGIDVYPGARALSDADRTTSSDGVRVSESFVSPATMTEVINFYKARMVGFASIYASGDGVVVSIKHDAQDSVLVAISPAQSGGKTKFSISHTTTKTPN